MSGTCIRQRVYYFSIGSRQYKQVKTLLDITPPSYWCALCNRPVCIPSSHDRPASNFTTIRHNNDTIDLTEDDNDTIDLTDEDNDQRTTPNGNN